MHPELTSSEPGTCPKCGMKLVAAAPTTYVCPMHPELTSSLPCVRYYRVADRVEVLA